MPQQILTMKLDGITAGDYLTWCRDPEPPALDLTLRSISIDTDPLADTITVTLDWSQPPPPVRIAAAAAGLPLLAGVEIYPLLADGSHARPVFTGAGSRLTCVPAAAMGTASIDAGQRLARAAA
jgi:hypothetical protein